MRYVWCGCMYIVMVTLFQCLADNVHVDDTVLYQCCGLPGLQYLAVACCPAISDIGLAQLAARATGLQHLVGAWNARGSAVQQ